MQNSFKIEHTFVFYNMKEESVKKSKVVTDYVMLFSHIYEKVDNVTVKLMNDTEKNFESWNLFIKNVFSLIDEKT